MNHEIEALLGRRPFDPSFGDPDYIKAVIAQRTAQTNGMLPTGGSYGSQISGHQAPPVIKATQSTYASAQTASVQPVSQATASSASESLPNEEEYETLRHSAFQSGALGSTLGRSSNHGQAPSLPESHIQGRRQIPVPPRDQKVTLYGRQYPLRAVEAEVLRFDIRPTLQTIGDLEARSRGSVQESAGSGQDGPHPTSELFQTPQESGS